MNLQPATKALMKKSVGTVEAAFKNRPSQRINKSGKAGAMRSLGSLSQLGRIASFSKGYWAFFPDISHFLPHFRLYGVVSLHCCVVP